MGGGGGGRVGGGFPVHETRRSSRERVLEVCHRVLVEGVVVLRGYTKTCVMTSQPVL